MAIRLGTAAGLVALLAGFMFALYELARALRTALFGMLVVVVLAWIMLNMLGFKGAGKAIGRRALGFAVFFGKTILNVALAVGRLCAGTGLSAGGASVSVAEVVAHLAERIVDDFTRYVIWASV